MGKKHIHRFYRSDAWKVARQVKIAFAAGLCESCSAIGEEVHHKIILTPENVTDVNITIIQNNLMLLCKDCHNKIHNRFIIEQHFDKDGNPLI